MTMESRCNRPRRSNMHWTICRWTLCSTCLPAATARPIACRIRRGPFRAGSKGWPLVKAICDYVHDRLTFGYQYASPGKTAWTPYRTTRRVPRFCPPRHHAVPLHEHTGALLHRLSRDIGVPWTTLRWISAAGSSLSRRPLVYVRRPPQ